MKCTAFFISCALYLGCAALGLAGAETATKETPAPKLTPAELEIQLVGLVDECFAALERFETKRSEFEAFIIG